MAYRPISKYDSLRYDTVTVKEFNVDWKAESGQLNLARISKKVQRAWGEPGGEWTARIWERWRIEEWSVIL